MRKNFSKKLLERVNALTGYKDDELYIVTGVAYMTAFVGHIPMKGDLSEFMGLSRRRIIYDEKETYMLAADMISRGLCLWFGEGVEPPAHELARKLLNDVFDPKYVYSESLFTGYIVLLEFLSEAAVSGQDDVASFVGARFSRHNKVLRRVERFADLIVWDGVFPFEVITRQDLQAFCNHLARETHKAFTQSDYGTSAVRAKDRLQALLSKESAREPVLHASAKTV